MVTILIEPGFVFSHCSEMKVGSGVHVLIIKHVPDSVMSGLCVVISVVALIVISDYK